MFKNLSVGGTIIVTGLIIIAVGIVYFLSACYTTEQDLYWRRIGRGVIGITGGGFYIILGFLIGKILKWFFPNAETSDTQPPTP